MPTVGVSWSAKMIKKNDAVPVIFGLFAIWTALAVSIIIIIIIIN
jgi:hypothetical protein